MCTYTNTLTHTCMYKDVVLHVLHTLPLIGHIGLHGGLAHISTVGVGISTGWGTVVD